MEFVHKVGLGQILKTQQHEKETPTCMISTSVAAPLLSNKYDLLWASYDQLMEEEMLGFGLHKICTLCWDSLHIDCCHVTVSHRGDSGGWW